MDKQPPKIQRREGKIGCLARERSEEKEVQTFTISLKNSMSCLLNSKNHNAKKESETWIVPKQEGGYPNDQNPRTR